MSLSYCVVNRNNNDTITPNFVNADSSIFDYSIGRNRVSDLHFNRWKVADA